MKKGTRFPQGWDDTRVRAVLEHYENQSEDEAAEEDEAAFRKRGQTVMVVPTPLVSAITRLITREGTIMARGRHNPPLQSPSGVQRVRRSKSKRKIAAATRGSNS